MNSTLHIARAFFLRDMIQTASYRLSFVLQLFGIFFSVAMFYFISRLIGNQAQSYLAPYGSDYFTFALVGMTLTNYLSTAMSTFSGRIREGQMSGTLEAMLATPTSMTSILLSSCLWDFCYTSLRIVIFLGFGMFVFGVRFPEANVFSALVVLLLTITSFSAFGILSAAFIVVFKQGDPINFFLGSLSSLMSGVFFPIEVMPGWLQPFSLLFPLTHALHAFRQCLVMGKTLADVWPQMLILLTFTIVLLPISIFLFEGAVNRAKKEGTLLQY